MNVGHLLTIRMISSNRMERYSPSCLYNIQNIKKVS